MPADGRPAWTAFTRPHRPTGELSVWPAAHTAGITTFNQALCNRHKHAFPSNQGGPFEYSGEVVTGAI